jgi:hypothetical protein
MRGETRRLQMGEKRRSKAGEKIEWKGERRKGRAQRE